MSNEIEETEEQVRERRAKVHAIHTLNNTAVEIFICLRIPEGKLTPEGAKILSGRQYVSVESLDSLDVVEAVKFTLRALQSTVVNELNKQVCKALAEEQVDDGRSQEQRTE